MKRLEEIEARVTALGDTSNKDAWYNYADDVPWLCEKLREAVALLDEAAFCSADGSVTEHHGALYARRDALLAALDEVTR